MKNTLIILFYLMNLAGSVVFAAGNQSIQEPVFINKTVPPAMGQKVRVKVPRV